MAASIASTVGGASSNSYLSIADATTISETMLGTLAWTSATTDERTRALIMATRLIDQLSWVGDRTDTTQALAWPRTDVECDEIEYASDEIPEPITLGQFDIAEALLADPDVLTGRQGSLAGELVPGIPNASLRSLRLDVLSLDFKNDSSGYVRRNILNVLPHLVDTFGCLCLSGPASAYGAKRVVRG
jgi:hypothetical protein